MARLRPFLSTTTARSLHNAQCNATLLWLRFFCLSISKHYWMPSFLDSTIQYVFYCASKQLVLVLQHFNLLNHSLYFCSRDISFTSSFSHFFFKLLTRTFYSFIVVIRDTFLNQELFSSSSEHSQFYCIIPHPPSHTNHHCLFALQACIPWEPLHISCLPATRSRLQFQLLLIWSPRQ